MVCSIEENIACFCRDCWEEGELKKGSSPRLCNQDECKEGGRGAGTGEFVCFSLEGGGGCLVSLLGYKITTNSPSYPSQASAGTGNALGFDLAAGCTPVILKGAQHRPRGRLGGGVASRGGEEERETPGPGWGIRAALEALGSRQTAGVGGGSGGGDDRNRGADDREIEERATKMARLEGEIERLRSENLRWQKVGMVRASGGWMGTWLGDELFLGVRENVVSQKAFHVVSRTAFPISFALARA